LFSPTIKVNIVPEDTVSVQVGEFKLNRARQLVSGGELPVRQVALLLLI